MKKLFLVQFIFSFFYSHSLFSSEYITSDNFKSIYEKALELGAKCGVEKTLVVFDIDNTLFATAQDLGGDAWFNWQSELLSKNPDSKDLVSTTFDGLLNIQGLLFSLSDTILVDQEAPKIVLELQEKGFPSIALTSRGKEFRDVTLRELKKHKISFLVSPINETTSIANAYAPYDSEKIEDSNITKEEALKWKLPNAPRSVLFHEGVYFGSGQHKGAMLRSLLKKLNFDACGIVLLDDTAKNTDRVFMAYENTSVDIRAIRYSKYDTQVNHFNESTKEDVRTQWEQIKNLLNSVFNINY